MISFFARTQRITAADAAPQHDANVISPEKTIRV
jgi:hypothetical protein